MRTSIIRALQLVTELEVTNKDKLSHAREDDLEFRECSTSYMKVALGCCEILSEAGWGDVDGDVEEAFVACILQVCVNDNVLLLQKVKAEFGDYTYNILKEISRKHTVGCGENKKLLMERSHNMDAGESAALLAYVLNKMLGCTDDDDADLYFCWAKELSASLRENSETNSDYNEHEAISKICDQIDEHYSEWFDSREKPDFRPYEGYYSKKQHPM